MAFFYGMLIAGSLLGLILLVLIFSLLALAQRGDYYLEKIAILAGRNPNSGRPGYLPKEMGPEGKPRK